MKAAAARTRIQLKNILVTTDFSSAATLAAPYTKALAKQYGSTIYALKRPETVTSARVDLVVEAAQ